MLLTPHVFVGLAAGAAISNPFIAVPLAFAMHFMGDKVPHWDFYSDTTKEERRVGWRPIAVMADMAVGIFFGLTATYYALWVLNDSNMALNLFLCGIASVLPDVLSGPYIFMKKEPKVLRPISALQSKMQFQAPLPWGLLTQIFIVAVCVLVFIYSIL